MPDPDIAADADFAPRLLANAAAGILTLKGGPLVNIN